MDRHMEGHIIQKWYEFTTGDRKNDRYGWDYRLVIENDDRYGGDYRLVIEDDDRRNGQKSDWWSRMMIAMDRKAIEYWEHDRCGRKTDRWWKTIIQMIENIEWRLVIQNVDRLG